MSAHRSFSPPTGRITLVLFAVVAGAIAFPWHTVRERWVLGIAIVAVIVLLARWQGLPVTTILRRRLAILRPSRGVRRADESVTDVRTTALLRVTPPLADADALPLSLIAGYAERYGLRAEAIRVTSRDSTSEVGTRERETWIGVTLSAASNLAALQARSAHIPLHETAEVAARRLADHLRESGWTAALAAPDDVPAPYSEIRPRDVVRDLPGKHRLHCRVWGQGRHRAAEHARGDLVVPGPRSLDGGGGYRCR